MKSGERALSLFSCPGEWSYIMRFIYLYRLGKGHITGFITLFIFTIATRISYTYVPLFTQYLIGVLMRYANPDVTLNPVNLPSFLINWFESAPTILMIGLYVAIGLFLWQLIRFILMFFESFMRGHIQEGIAKNMRTSLYTHIQDLSYRYHNNVDTGDLIQRVTSDVEMVSGFIVMRTFEFFGIIAGVTFGAIQMAHINTMMMWLCLSIIPVYATASIIYFLNVDKLFQRVEEKEAEMMTVIQENVHASKVVKAFGNENFEIEKMEEKNRGYADINIKANTIVAYFWSIMDLIMMIQFLGIIVLGVYYASNGLIDVASVAAALMLVGTMIWPVRGLGRLINDFGKALVATSRIKYLFDQKSEFDEDGYEAPEIKGHIIFDKVSFQFEDAKEPLLEDISFEVKPGETVAFIGKTGCGKTTIINLLMRMYDYEGSIKIDGIELRDIKKRHMRSNIGAVLQDPFLYSKTVYQNIAITNRNATQEDVKNAAGLAALEKDIYTFKQGYETKVGERGTTLSGGQKQRVAIARVLLSEKPILLLDDALSALDNQTDLLIRNALANRPKKSTNLIITHRITTAKEADKIIVVNKGRVEAIGTHQTLSKKAGLYQSLWNIQGKIEQEFLDMLGGESHA